MTSANEQSIAQVAPIQKSERILFLDSIRGIALLGILLMNIMAQSNPQYYYDKMDITQPLTGANFYAWAVEVFLLEGTMRGLFSILFGAGAVLLIARLGKKHHGLEPADIYYRRLLWLLAFGLIDAFIFLWPGDILYSYALCGLLLFPFRNLSAKKLLLIALALLAIGTYRENSDLYKYKNIITKGKQIEQLETKKLTLTESQQADLAVYKAYKGRTSAEALSKQAQEEAKQVKEKNYVELLAYNRDKAMGLQSAYFYTYGWWDVLIFFFMGMALYRSGFLSGEKSNSLYGAIAIIGIGVGTYMSYAYNMGQYRLGFDAYKFVEKWIFNFYEIRRVLQTMGYLSLLILLYKWIPFKKILHAFVPVGQMAFTNYLMQSIITSIIFYACGLYNSLQRYEVYYVVLAIWVFQFIFSYVWLRYFNYGPFEWLWRSLTYQKKQLMKKR